MKCSLIISKSVSFGPQRTTILNLCIDFDAVSKYHERSERKKTGEKEVNYIKSADLINMDGLWIVLANE